MFTFHIFSNFITYTLTLPSFRLVFDRETGKPKGYGFCEYKDAETALSAMRNLNGYEIGGRTLRVDNACTEKSRLEMQSKLVPSVLYLELEPPAEYYQSMELFWYFSSSSVYKCGKLIWRGHQRG